MDKSPLPRRAALAGSVGSLAVGILAGEAERSLAREWLVPVAPEPAPHRLDRSV